MKKLMVTGGSGFFGTELINYLLEKGNAVLNFDIEKPDIIDLGTQYIKGDILNYGEILKASKDVDTIFHNVANLPLAENKNKYHSLNVLGTTNVLKAALENNIRKVIYTSTGAVFGVPEKNPVFAEDIPKPKEEYGLTKYLGEKVCQEFVKKGLSVTIVRPNTILGIGRLGTLSLLFKWISEGYNIPVFSGGKNIYQFTHSRDLSRLCYLASMEDKAEIYNCGAKDEATMLKIMEQLCAFSSTKSRVKSVPFWPAVFMMNFFSFIGLSPLGSYHSLMYGRSLYFDMKKNKINLGWEPEYTNYQMFEQSYASFIEEKDRGMLDKKSKYDHHSVVKEGILGIIKKVF